MLQLGAGGYRPHRWLSLLRAGWLMTMRWLLVLCGAGLVGAGLILGASAMTAVAQTAAGQPRYSLQVNTRIVLTDVTVTDKQGEPVHGLKGSDFQIFDNKKPQQIASFEEHRKSTAAPWLQPATAPGVYSNDYIAHPPGVVNVVLLDLTNLGIQDQMYLNFQLGKFIDALRPDEPIAIYARTGPACILVQGFTSDRALLRAAVRKILPRFPPRGPEYLSDFQTLQQIEAYLAEIPGRKNVLWFSGGSTLYLRPDATQMDNYRQWQAVYDDLEANRIAVYPIDARGLTVYGGPFLSAQHGVMSDVAEATGGRALYDNNGLALFASRTVDEDGDYYTLTYTPRDLKYDNKWHKVHVTVPGAYYTLSYRHGYFGDANVQQEKRPDRTRTQLLASGSTQERTEDSRKPILFQARVVAGAVPNLFPQQGGAEAIAPTPSPRRGTTPYTVRYLVPLDAFQMARTDGKWSVQCASAVLAFNSDGTLLSRKGQQTTFTLRDEAANAPAGKVLPVDEEVDLAKGDVYLYLAIWDMRSKRLGSLEIPFHVDAVKGTTRDHPK